MKTDTKPRQAVETFAIHKEIEIAAPIELAFEAVLDELGPEGQMPDGKSLRMRIEAWPGGRWYRDLGNNAGHLWGHVQVIKPPALLEICGPFMMSYPAINHLQYRLKAEGAGTRLTILHRAMGLIPPEYLDGMSEDGNSDSSEFSEIAEKNKQRSIRNETMKTAEHRFPSQSGVARRVVAGGSHFWPRKERRARRRTQPTAARAAVVED